MTFSLVTAFRASHYRTLTQVGLSEKRLIVTTTDSWFVKIVSTLFLCSTSFDDEILDYFHKHLTPSYVLEIIKRLNNPNLGFKFYQFTREKLSMSHSFWTYNMLLRSLCQANLHSSAKLLYDSMRSDGQLPDSRLLGFLVPSFALADRFDVSKELLAEALCNGNQVKSFVYNPVIDGYCKSGNIDEANAIVAEMEEKCKPDKLTFTILIIGHCMKGRTLEAIGIFYKMLEAGSTPDDITIRTLSSCLLKAGMPREASHINETIFEKQSTLLKKSYNESISSDKSIHVH
ncbi:pentatricopeptide repeat-containing protein At2g06000 isoform X3 [Vigna radiata var. radiata]|uniref:Pentatricopeptide repeat-containing protein At2g06000 isoform X3 n=1 Tax=Vigna radiata var. radiata TaxID=3916 RepID=A0A3Q0FHK3_VIGRR|nr:pentatricopeptide repeat-containing protein At2g06000 isoform X3 [Vigna radiata var. radiata]